VLIIIQFSFHRTVSAMPLANLQNAPKLQSSSMILVSVSCLGSVPNAQTFFFVVDVMQVAHHYFENGIAHFTRRINKCISMACANGEVAPFVGHNAFLRWSALQDAAFNDPGDNNRKKIWSETNVSEDFDMALRLQVGVLSQLGRHAVFLIAHVRSSSRDTSFGGRPILKAASRKVSR
jgi:Glycosyl transferase family group 2